MAAYDVSAPAGWKVVGKLHDAERPSLLDSQMVELTYPGTRRLIYAGWEPEEDINGHYVIGAIDGCESLVNPISVDTVQQALDVLERIAEFCTPQEPELICEVYSDFDESKEDDSAILCSLVFTDSDQQCQLQPT